MTRFFVTGATGFLGREVVVRLLAAGHSTLVVSRQKPGESTEMLRDRLIDLLRSTDSEVPIDQLEVAAADVTFEDLRLSEAGRSWLAEDGDDVQILHGAAQVRFDLPWAEMERQNIRGTHHVIALAERLRSEGRLRRLDYVSTCYVAGDRTDVALESDLDVGQTPRNTYEGSKLEAEKALAEHRAAGLPTTIHRPSIIVGDSRTGRASSFKVLYWPLKVYARGRWRTVFGRPDCPVDIVPVDYVADAMMHLLAQDEASGKTFHLAAGPERQSTIGEIAKLAEEFFGQKPVRYFDPDIYLKYIRPWVRPILKLTRPDVVDAGKVYLPYLRSNPVFDVSEASRLLGPAGIIAPKVHDYFETIMGYAKERAFGSRARAQLPG